MLKYESQRLDRAFHALSDSSRRAIIDRLRKGPASVSELAKPFAMSLSAVSQHLKVLKEAGLIDSVKAGRVRTCVLDVQAMAMVERWIAERERFWEQQYDQLDAYLARPATSEEY